MESRNLKGWYCMKNFLNKLTSRKFLACLSGIVLGIAIIFGVDGDTVTTVAGAVTSLISTVTYIIAEGNIDANRIKNTIEVVQEAVETIEKEGE